MEYEFRPIDNWPGALSQRRRRAPFKAGYDATLRLLDHELRQLAARHIVIQVALSPSEIRMDGRPRADAKPPRHPGVIVAFDSKHGPLTYPCDTFDQWQDNLRAIALALEHLRAVDRYGVTRRGEQYRGWNALPPPIVTEPPMNRETAMAVLRRFAPTGFVLTNKQQLAELYRVLVMKVHPDRGGNAADFKQVQRAKEALEAALP